MDLPLKKANSKPGRPGNVTQKNVFLQVCNFKTDNEDDQFTLSQLSLKMKEFLNTDNKSVYRYLKCKLKEEFSEEISFSNSSRKADIVTIKRTADSIIRQCFENCK